MDHIAMLTPAFLRSHPEAEKMIGKTHGSRGKENRSLQQVGQKMRKITETQPHPKWWFSKGHLFISGKSRLVNEYFIWPDVWGQCHSKQHLSNGTKGARKVKL